MLTMGLVFHDNYATGVAHTGTTDDTEYLTCNTSSGPSDNWWINGWDFNLNTFGTGTKNIGFRFADANGTNFYYGWIELSVDLASGLTTFHQYAYEDIANTAILVCDEGGTNTILVNLITIEGQGGATTINSANGTLQMTATVLPTNATDNTFTWSVTNGSGSATIDVTGLLTASSEGTVTVSATANDGSEITGRKEITISEQSVGVIDFDNKSLISAYPNPVKDYLNITSTHSISRIAIFNTLGEEVYTSKLNTKHFKLDMTNFEKGTYFIKIYNQTNSIKHLCTNKD